MPQGYRREFGLARARLQHGILLGGVLAVIGLWVLVFAGPSLPDRWLIGGVNLALASGILLYSLRRARDRRPRLVIDDDGVWFHEWGAFSVPWEQIAETYTSGSRLQSYLCLRLRDPEAFLASLTEETRAKLKPGRLLRPPELLIPHAAVEASFDEIEEALRQGRAAAAANGQVR